MAKIQCPKEYNYWYILANAGIDPVKDVERYSYDETTEELSADVTQLQLEQALAQYDHQAWLNELEQLNKTREEQLEQRIDELELFILMREGLV